MPLSSNRIWYTRIAELAERLCDGGVQEEPACLREAIALFSAAPAGQKGRFARLPSTQVLEMLIAADAGESAALALLPQDAAYIVSRGTNGIHLASVMLDGIDEEVAAEASTAGLAILAAFAGALLHAAPLPLVPADPASLGPRVDIRCLH
jgi:hypothetical protein